MNVDIIILLIISILLGIGSVYLLKYEWKCIGKEEAKDKFFWGCGIALLVELVILILVMVNVYPGTQPYIIFRDMTVVSLVWLAAITDLKFYIISNETILAGGAIWVVYTIYKALCYREILVNDLIDEVVTFFVIAVCLGLCLLIMKNSIGMGDVKLLLLMCLYFGMADMLSIVFLSLLCSFVAAIVVLIRKTKKRSDALPFGPFLFAGTYIGMLLSGI